MSNLLSRVNRLAAAVAPKDEPRHVVRIIVRDDAEIEPGLAAAGYDAERGDLAVIRKIVSPAHQSASPVHG